MDAPPLPRSYYSSWGQGSGALDIIMQSTPTSADPRRVDHAQIIFQQNNKCILIGAPAAMGNVIDLTLPIHETWLEGLQALAISFEQTAAAQAISAYIRSTPYLPASPQDYFINAIFAEAQDAARTAASREHRTVRMDCQLNISVGMVFDDDYAGSAEDDEDDVEAAVVMGLGDLHAPGRVDAAAVEINVEEEDAAFGVVGMEILAGNNIIEVAQPVDLEAEEIDHVEGLSPEAIANHLTVDNLMGGDPVRCVICLENMVEGSPAGRLPCGHVFHPWCITEWLERSGTCPICRHQFPAIDD